MLDNKDCLKLLIPLIQFPWLASFLEVDYIDDLEARGFWSMETFSVTSAGRDFCARNEAALYTS